LFTDEEGLRAGFLRALVAFGALAVLITESLSVFHALRPAPVAAAWTAIIVAAIYFTIRRKRFNFHLARPSLLDGALIACVAAIEIVIAITAIASPPNSADAMAYHMPRVVYWVQHASVAFFATPYLNQIMLQPMAEYLMLHTYLLSGGDRFVNLIQWLGSAGSVVGVSLIAREIRPQVRAQALASVFCATLPNGILQASGAKNDYLLALWLVAMTWFGYRWIRTKSRWDAVFFGLSLGLALLTKGTAYLYAPPLIAALFLPILLGRERRRLLLNGAVALACVLLVNGPQYWRNIDLSGSPLGFDSAQGDGFFRWRNECFGWKQTVSNLLRNTSDQLGARNPQWNRGVFDVVVSVHKRLGIDVDDPATTWRWSKFEPPRNANHEANANNRWHLALILAIGIVLLVKRRPGLELFAAVLCAFVLFCFYLKWQPFEARLLLPLFVLCAPVAGIGLGCVRFPVVQALICLFLLNNARPALFENWTRPWKGPNSIWTTPRDSRYFADMSQWPVRDSYPQAVDLVMRSGCKSIGIDANQFQLEYPFEALLLERDRSYRFTHVGVKNASAKYAARDPKRPCVVLCLRCAGLPSKIDDYKAHGAPVQIGDFLLFAPPANP